MLKKAYSIIEDLIYWRRDFHQHPELGFAEQRTSTIVANELKRLGYAVQTGIGKTGVVAEIGTGNGPTIAIRADMDALPIMESDDRSYASQNAGIMHACGHDSHTAMALGAALLLSKETLPGKVKFIFQPSEEMADDEGFSGATRMIQDGVLDHVDFIIAQHVDPHAPTGTIGISAGPISGGVENWYGKIIGKGGHGAYPNQTIDPFFILSHIILGINSIVSRQIDPFDPAAISIGVINGGFTQNVIPEFVEISGTLRYTNSSVHQKLITTIKQVFEITKIYGGNYELRFEFQGDPVINHLSGYKLIQSASTKVIGTKNIHPETPALGAEDFGAFTEKIPGAMFTLGTLIEGDERILHHPRFDIDEKAMPIGTAILVQAVFEFFQNTQDYI